MARPLLPPAPFEADSFEAAGDDEEHGVQSGWQERIDLHALLVALVLVPHSYPRNRFYGLYRWAPARRVRRRAALLRSLVADLSAAPEAVELERYDRGGARLRYRLRDLEARRTTVLDGDELALLKLALERACGGELPPAVGGALSQVDAAAGVRIAALMHRLYERG